MFHNYRSKNGFSAAFSIWRLILLTAAHSVRSKHKNALLALVQNMLQALVLFVVFGALIAFMGRQAGGTIRGDFVLYVATGIFLFLTFNKSMKAVFSSGNALDTMLLHAPLNTTIAIFGAALGTLYIQVLTIFFALSIYWLGWGPFEIYDPVGTLAMLLLTWLCGSSVGMVLMGVKPWFPKLTQIIMTIYQRANMFTSGKMFVANSIPAFMLPFFSWNPLFHTIDQARGYAFINYTPRNTSLEYPLIFCATLMVIGLLLEFYTRKHVSLHWNRG